MGSLVFFTLHIHDDIIYLLVSGSDVENNADNSRHKLDVSLSRLPAAELVVINESLIIFHDWDGKVYFVRHDGLLRRAENLTSIQTRETPKLLPSALLRTSWFPRRTRYLSSQALL